GLPWPALGRSDNGFRLFLGNHWLDAAGRVLVNDDARAALPFDLAPGEEAEIPLVVRAPAAGEYVLEVDLVQESVSWFGLKGSATLKQKVTVEP
nr:SAM-dependent methyltransferase [Acidobacteriota bacterium]